MNRQKLDLNVIDTCRETAFGRRRVFSKNMTTYWWILPPISFLIQPVVANAAGDAY